MCLASSVCLPICHVCLYLIYLNVPRKSAQINRHLNGKGEKCSKNCASPVFHRYPKLFYRLYYLLWQRTLRNTRRILLNLPHLCAPNDDSVLLAQHGMMKQPPERHIAGHNSVCLTQRFHLLDSSMQTCVVILSAKGIMQWMLLREPRALICTVGEIRSEETRGKRFVGMVDHVVGAEKGKQAGFHATGQNVVFTLIDSGFDIVVLVADMQESL